VTRDLTVAVMAGGKSSRMGRNKAFVTLRGRPLIEHVLARVGALESVAGTILLANEPEPYAYLGLPTYPDLIPDKGALGGLYTALHHSPTEAVLAVACDMPFINVGLLRHLDGLRAEAGGPYDAIVPRVEGYPQGMLAIYTRACLPAIRQRIDEDRLKLRGFHDLVRVRYVDEPEYHAYDPQGLSFFNVNTPDELEAAARLADESG